MANKVYIKDKDGNDLLVATDWSIIQNKPSNLATTNQLPVLGAWQRDGIIYKNGAYDWDHVNNGYNCAYRIADLLMGMKSYGAQPVRVVSLSILHLMGMFMFIVRSLVMVTSIPTMGY